LSPPEAKDLFLQLWCVGMNDHDEFKPGDPEFNGAVRAKWLGVWRDCQRMAQAMVDYDALMEEARLSRDPVPD
jgi:hypothetical protein